MTSVPPRAFSSAASRLLISAKLTSSNTSAPSSRKQSHTRIVVSVGSELMKMHMCQRVAVTERGMCSCCSRAATRGILRATSRSSTRWSTARPVMLLA